MLLNGATRGIAAVYAPKYKVFWLILVAPDERRVGGQDHSAGSTGRRSAAPTRLEDQTRGTEDAWARPTRSSR
jgi:hypothetical protein